MGWMLYTRAQAPKVRVEFILDVYDAAKPYFDCNLYQWYHIVATYDGTTRRFYVNGLLKASSAHAAYTIPTTNLEFGRYGSKDGTRNLNGLIDEVRIYNEALPQAEIQKHYVEGLKRYQLVQK